MHPTIWSHRGIQLDLARQYERPDQIQRFITQAASWGFTHVYLYLEGRIRTASFPYPARETSYDANTMRRIVRHAGKHGIEIVPVVPCFGHVEQFLAHKPLAHLAEIPVGGVGRFGKSKGTCACPSNPATFEFFSNYYREIADIFPSPYFHIGMDEAFDVGLCPRCKRFMRNKGPDEFDNANPSIRQTPDGGRRVVAADTNGLNHIFATLVTKITHFVEKDLGKTVLMWDDMLEACPAAIHRIPTSIILCVWLYDEVFEKPWSRFFNRTRANLIPYYAQHGFRSIASCRDVSMLNVDSVTEHGQTSPSCIGGLVTSWEHSTDFIQQFHPIMAYAGHCWSKPRTERSDALTSFFGKVSPEVHDALKQTLSRRTWMRHTNLAGHSRGLPTLQDRERQLATDHILATLTARARRHIKPSARPTWDCIQMDLEFESIHHSLSNLIPHMTLEVGRGRRTRRLELQANTKELISTATRLESLVSRHEQFWSQVRRDIPIGTFPSSLEAFAKEIRTFARRSPSKKHWLVRLHGFLPDRFGVPIVDIAIQLSGSRSWHTIHHGSIKTFWDEQPYYEYWIKTPNWTKAPRALRIQISGHGGHGFRYVEIETPKGRFIPSRVISTQGIVDHPNKLLTDDKRWTWLGEESVRAAYQQPKLSYKQHSLIMGMKHD